MRSPGLCGLRLSVTLLLFSVAVDADTIVLKNGRRIVALNVVEERDKVHYTTSAGELSLPKSIVDHVERDGSVPDAARAGRDAANLAIGPPEQHPAGGNGERVARAAWSRQFRSRLDLKPPSGFLPDALP